MNSKTTGIWFAIAATLAAFIFVYQHYFAVTAAGSIEIMRGLRPSEVTSVRVIPAGQREIRADRTNSDWYLTKPILFPAQSAAVESLLAKLQKLSPDLKITAAELRQNKNAETQYGFDNPQTSLMIETPDRRWQLLVGNKTAPGNQVYLQVVGTDGAFVADAKWLASIPQTADEWRDTSLIAAGKDFDWLVITNGMSVIELRTDSATHLWRMVRPLAARADAGRITDALQRLQTARVTQFITDDSNADLTQFGLQPPALDLWLGRGTNLLAALHLGKNPANDPAQLFGEREGWNGVFTTAKEPLAAWFGTKDEFRDRNLLELTAPVAEIEVNGPNHFSLQRQGGGTNDWKIAGEKFPVDAATVQAFIAALAGLQIEHFVLNAVTAPDLQNYGFTPAPQAAITLRSKIGDTNSTIAQLLFGAAQTNEVFVRRADEEFIYAITADNYNKLLGDGSLFGADWMFRDRRIWHFDMPKVRQVTIHQGGKTRVLVHNGKGKWSLASGSNGIITGASIEQAVTQLSNLTADGWVARNFTDPSQFGIKPDGLEITVELEDGQKDTVDFGAPIFNGNNALAAVTVDGERWAFVFPAIPYQFAQAFLTIPANGM